MKNKNNKYRNNNVLGTTSKNLDLLNINKLEYDTQTLSLESASMHVGSNILKSKNTLDMFHIYVSLILTSFVYTFDLLLHILLYISMLLFRSLKYFKYIKFKIYNLKCGKRVE